MSEGIRPDGRVKSTGSCLSTFALSDRPGCNAQMSIHRQIAQMMRSAAGGGLGPNISHIEFTEGTGYTLNDTGDAGLDADGASIQTGTSWTTEQGKDVLVTAYDDETSPCAWTQFSDLNSYLVGADIKWSACFHMRVTKLPQYIIGMVMAKHAVSRCGGNQSFYVAFEADMKLRFAIIAADNSYRIALSDTAPVSVGTWFKLVVTYDGAQDGNNGLDRIKLYINGAELSSSMGYENGGWPFDLTAAVGAGTHVSFGSSMSTTVSCRNFGLESEWADYMLFDRVLSAAEVAQYQGGF